MNVPVSVKATDCESDIKELLATEAVRFGVLTASGKLVLVPIVPDDTNATVLPAVAVYVPPDVILPLVFKKYVPFVVLAVLVNPPLALSDKVAAVESDTYADPFAADIVRFLPLAVPLTANVLVKLVPTLPTDDTITTVGAVIVTPVPVVKFIPLALVASAKYVPVVGLTLFGLDIVGQQFNNDGTTIATLPVYVSSTYTEPVAAVAEKFVAENVIGDVIDVPTLPAVESNTNVVAFDMADTESVIEPVDINAADPLCALIVAFVNEMPALVPDASRIMLLASSMVLVPNDIVLPAEPKFAVLLTKYVPLEVLATFCVLSAASTSVAACESVRYTEPLVACAVTFGVLIANGVAHVAIPLLPLDINSTAFAATGVYVFPDVMSPFTFK